MLTIPTVRFLSSFMFCTVLIVVLALPILAATLYVSPNGSDDNAGTLTAPYKTIQTAVNNAASGNTIEFAYAIYQGNGNRPVSCSSR